MKKFVSVLFIVSSIVSISAHAALADHGDKKVSAMEMPPMTSEQRHKMADAHEKMAACLRTDKPIGDCHEEMMKACQEGMGKDGCPMMGGRGKGMHHSHMMESGGSDSKSTK